MTMPSLFLRLAVLAAVIALVALYLLADPTADPAMATKIYVG
ncbi:hypothetical protein [Paractinoplanes atraurantiacus]|uniref:Uncharacterized protein n=1 Tax=Paractinoplanes atraurantiacus TaxID=1036182 RepID=A0A285HTX7_9ACTN|nr:hypothetical protein [Actinoplanes atraurantiacus]SNY39160.1 hypothetical protein SAMN05421748_105318 [Actinoplanes atraurantiacus]